MECWKEEAIEWAAIRVVDGERSPEIDRLIAHARECVRCGELLALFEGMERGIRRDLPVARILPLVRLHAGDRRPSPAGDLEFASTPSAYDLAAETAKPAQTMDVTLSTEDGSLYVRIFPIAGGKGAHAVLLSPADAQDSVSLRIGGVAYPFDDSGIVEIPEFPTTDIQLIVT
jgi:hypothetical protein